MDEGQALQVRQ